MVLQSIGTYFGFGPQRNVNLNKETKKSPEFKNLEQIGEQFGYDTKLPVLGNLSVKEFAAENRGRMIPENKDVITRKGKQYLVDKDRPTGPAKLLAGFMDIFDPEADRDKLGGMGSFDDKGRYAYNPVGGLQEFDPKDYSKLQLNPGEIRKATKEFKQETAGPTSGLEEQVKMLTGSTGDDLIDFYSRAGKRAAGDAFQQYALTEPIRQAYNQRAANIAQQRLLDARGVLEQMPSSVQDIMSKKQEQILKSQVGAADLNRSIADQQDAATRMAGLGMQQKFGQNVVFTPPLLRG